MGVEHSLPTREFDGFDSDRKMRIDAVEEVSELFEHLDFNLDTVPVVDAVRIDEAIEHRVEEIKVETQPERNSNQSFKTIPSAL